MTAEEPEDRSTAFVASSVPEPRTSEFKEDGVSAPEVSVVEQAIVLPDSDADGAPITRIGPAVIVRAVKPATR
jgi:hypothetical protein